MSNKAHRKSFHPLRIAERANERAFGEAEEPTVIWDRYKKTEV